MADNAVASEIIEFYDGAYEEAQRLTRSAWGRLEFARTLEVVRRYLPAAPARGLDVGGGPGVYAARLAAEGYAVTVVEPVPRHRHQAATYGTFTVEDGDARALRQADGSVDAVLLLGPLYHLVEPSHRAAALREAARVLRPGGLLAAAVISRHAALIDLAAQGRLDESDVSRVRALLAHGVNDPTTGFTTAYFHTLSDLHADFAAAELPTPAVYGLEGPLFAAARMGVLDDDPARYAAAIRAARLAERDPALLAASPHWLAVATP
jgi:SAM-dependent methyltransferase